MAQQSMRIEQAVDHHVVMLARRPQEGTSIVYDRANPGIGIGVLGMPLPALHKNRGIDLNGVDLLCSITQAGGNIVAGARADDRDIARSTPIKPIRQLVIIPDALQVRIGVNVVVASRQVVYPLIVMASRRNNHKALRILSHLQQLIRRINFLPARIGWPRENYQREDDGDRAEQLRSRAPDVKREQEAESHQEPNHRRSPEGAENEHE